MREVPDPPDGLTGVDPRTWTRAWRRVLTTPSVKLIGYECADWADYKTGANVRPGIPLLRSTTSPPMSNKTVGDALELMRQWGLLWRYHEARLSGIKGDRDIHRLTFPDDIAPIPMLSPDWEHEQLAACGQPGNHMSSRQVVRVTRRSATCPHDRWSRPTTCSHDRWVVDPTSTRPTYGGSVYPSHEDPHPSHQHGFPADQPQLEARKRPNRKAELAD